MSIHSFWLLSQQTVNIFNVITALKCEIIFQLFSNLTNFSIFPNTGFCVKMGYVGPFFVGPHLQKVIIFRKRKKSYLSWKADTVALAETSYCRILVSSEGGRPLPYKSSKF